MQFKESIFVLKFVFKEYLFDYFNYLEIKEQISIIEVVNILIATLEANQIKQFLVLCCCYFKLSKSEEIIDIIVDLVASFHLFV